MEEELTDVIIPFMGDTLTVTDKTVLAQWIEEQDRIPLLLAISLYQDPIREIGDYTLFSQSPRVAAWFNPKTGTAIIGCRGTSAFRTDGGKDLGDDTVSFVCCKRFLLLFIIHPSCWRSQLAFPNGVYFVV